MSLRIALACAALLGVSAPASARPTCASGAFVVHAGERPAVSAAGSYDVVTIAAEDARRATVAIAGACAPVRVRIRGRRLHATWSAARCGGTGRMTLKAVFDPGCEILHGTTRQARRPATRFTAARCASDGVVSEGTGEQCAAVDACGAPAACVDCRCVAPVSFVRDLQPVFTRSCLTLACHEGDNPTGGFQLTAAQAATSLRQRLSRAGVCVGQPLVVPGDPDVSVLFRRVAGVGCGGRMPLGPLPLPPATVDAIRAWIAGGATID